MVLHTSRTRSGRRRLDGIAVLQRGANGVVSVLPSWHADTGFVDGADALRQLIDRGSGL